MTNQRRSTTHRFREETQGGLRRNRRQGLALVGQERSSRARLAVTPTTANVLDRSHNPARWRSSPNHRALLGSVPRVRYLRPGPDAPSPTQTAVIVPVAAADCLVSEHRDNLDVVACWGVPAHVTVLYPFVDPAEVNKQLIEHGSPAQLCRSSLAPGAATVGLEAVAVCLWLLRSPMVSSNRAKLHCHHPVSTITARGRPPRWASARSRVSYVAPR